MRCDRCQVRGSSLLKQPAAGFNGPITGVAISVGPVPWWLPASLVSYREVSTPTTTITLPDALARDADQAGLLTSEAIERSVREQLKQSRHDRLQHAQEVLKAGSIPSWRLKRSTPKSRLGASSSFVCMVPHTSTAISGLLWGGSPGHSWRLRCLIVFSLLQTCFQLRISCRTPGRSLTTKVDQRYSWWTPDRRRADGQLPLAHRVSQASGGFTGDMQARCADAQTSEAPSPPAAARCEAERVPSTDIQIPI